MVGWRWWTVTGERLQSISHKVAWEGPTLRADKKPTKDNAHGIYAMTEKDTLVGYTPGDESRVYGEVELSETVVRAEKGLRGEVATIRSLFAKRRAPKMAENDGLRWREFVDVPSKQLITALENRYQVEVAITDDEPCGGGGLTMHQFAQQFIGGPSMQQQIDPTYLAQWQAHQQQQEWLYRQQQYYAGMQNRPWR